MKFRTRIISIMMIMMMVIGGMSFSSYAAAPKKGTVYVDVTQDYMQAQKMLTLINKQRSKKGLKKVKLDKSLTNAAVQRAAEIQLVIPTTSPHRRPNGNYAKTVHKLAVRENCAEGTYESSAAVVNTWMHSKGHKATILLKSARSCGIAYVHNPDDPYTGYFVLIMSNSKVKKVEKSKKQVDSTKAVVALSKYLKKKYFFQTKSSSKLYPGNMSKVTTTYFGPKTLDFTEPVINPKSFTWSSSDTSIVTVGADGWITAVGPGTATIKARLKKGPAITLTQEITVNEIVPENWFNGLTTWLKNNTSDNSWFGDGYSYEGGDAYVFSYYGGKMINDSYEDPETGEEEVISWAYEGDYIVMPETRAGEEVAFMHRYVNYENKELKEQHRTFMIVSKDGDKVSDTLTFVHEFLDENDNCVYKLTASAPRNAVNVDALQWEVVQETPAVEIDYEEIKDQLWGIFISDMYNYLYNRTGLKLRYLGISRVGSV
jgi:hypothetical protein